MLHSIMEYSGRELVRERRSMTVAELRNFFFQIIFALHKAQKKYQFMHGDLHMRNLLLKETNEKLVRDTGMRQA